MRLIVYGAGAVGGVIGARLHLAGLDVGLVARGAHLDAIRTNGLRLESADGVRTVRVPASNTVREYDVDSDTCVLLTVKSHQTAAAIDDLVGPLPEDATVACVQNGVANEPAVLRHFSHVLGVAVMLPSSHLEPGVVIAHSAPVPGLLDVGCFPSGADNRAEVLAESFRAAGFDSVVRTDVMAWKYRKLLTNLGNAVQASYRPGPDRDELTARVRAEGKRVLETARVAVVTEEQDAERRGNMTPGAFGVRGGGSTWQSLARGTGSVETDYLNGEVSWLGRLHGIPTPANDLVRQVAVNLARRLAEPSRLDAGRTLAELAAIE